MRKGFVYFDDPTNNHRTTPTLGQYKVFVNASGLLEVVGDDGGIITQTQFVGTGGTVPGQYLPLTGGTLTGPVIFNSTTLHKGDATFTNPAHFTNIITSGGTDLSIILSAIAAGGGGGGSDHYLPLSGGTGGPYTFTGGTWANGSLSATTIYSGGTDLSELIGSGGGGAVATYTNGVDNRVLTSSGADSINGESNMTFNGSTLAVQGTINALTQLQSGGTDLSTLIPAASPLATYTNGASNRVVTSTGADGIDAEQYFTYSTGAMQISDPSQNAYINLIGGTSDTQNKFGVDENGNQTFLHWDSEGEGADFYIRHGDADAVSAFFDYSGEVRLYYNNAMKFATTNTGINVTGSTYISADMSATTIYSGSTDLSSLLGGGGAVATYTNGVNNRVLTASGADSINGESNITFDGSTLAVQGTINAVTTLQSGGTDLSQVISEVKTTRWVAGNYSTLDEATEYPFYLNPSAGAVVTTGDLYQMQSGGGWSLADASASGTSIGLIGIPFDTNAKNGMLMQGVIALDSADFGGTAVQGATVYMSETAGNYTFDPPTTSGSVVRALGYYVESTTIGRSTAYLIYFNPSPDFFIVS